MEMQELCANLERNHYKPYQDRRPANKMYQQDLNKNLEKVPWLVVQQGEEDLD